MAIKIPWLLLCCACVPLFMIYTKSKRMDAREMHEITMRVKYHSEYWEKGNTFAHRLQELVDQSLVSHADPLKGRDVREITPPEWEAAARRTAAESREEEGRRAGRSAKRFGLF